MSNCQTQGPAASRQLAGLIGLAAGMVNQLVDELEAADHLVDELVAENEQLRERLERLEEVLRAPECEQRRSMPNEPTKRGPGSASSRTE